MATNKKPFWLATALILTAAAIGTYLYFQDKEYQYRFSESFLQQKIAERMPINKAYLGVFALTLDNAVVSLKQGQERIHIDIDTRVNINLLGRSTSIDGRVGLSSGIRYAAEHGAFFLSDPAVERFTLQGLPAQYADQVQTSLTRSLAEFYAQRPVYVLSDADLKQRAARLMLKQVTILDGEVIVTLGI